MAELSGNEAYSYIHTPPQKRLKGSTIRLLLPQSTPLEEPNWNFLNWFYGVLKEHFEIELTTDPDAALFGIFNHCTPAAEVLRYNGIRILLSGVEGVKTTRYLNPEYRTLFDYSFSLRPTDEYNYQISHLMHCHHLWPQMEHPDIEGLTAQKSRFCLFLYRNFSKRMLGSVLRQKFLRQLQAVRPVDTAKNALLPADDGNSRSRYWQDNYLQKTALRPPPVALRPVSKSNVLGPYKFDITFENETIRGYTTERLADSLLNGTIPIYWGNPEIDQIVNPERIINIHNFPSLAAAVEHIVAVDSDPQLYRQYLSAPLFANNQLPSQLRLEPLLDRLEQIFSRPKPHPVAQVRFYHRLNSVRFSPFGAWLRRTAERHWWTVKKFYYKYKLLVHYS